MSRQKRMAVQRECEVEMATGDASSQRLTLSLSGGQFGLLRSVQVNRSRRC
jgi:hypothetical protein